MLLFRLVELGVESIEPPANPFNMSGTMQSRLIEESL
jgi:hypothetical protein